MRTASLLLLSSLLLTYFASPSASSGLKLFSLILGAIKTKLLLPLAPILDAKKKQWLFGNTTDDIGIGQNTTTPVPDSDMLQSE